ncbi:MAG: hypothetical protein HQL99_02335 [Magnetococcales bacterium]|nr:hypothetical protein [Magnetococcales bacterium]
MIVKAESGDTVNAANFVAVRSYILNAMEKGRIPVSGWPLENFHAIPEVPDAEERAVALLGAWLDRHVSPKLRAMMFGDLREVQFEAAKRSAEVVLSQETRNALKQYRDRVFGEGQGSMELAVKQLLEMAGRTLPRDAHQLLETYRQRKGLRSAADAVRALVDLAERPPVSAPVASVTPVTPVASVLIPVGKPRPTGERALHREVKALLEEWKHGQTVLNRSGGEA